jgi:hypothetical protein
MVDRNIHIGIISTRAKQGAEEVKQALKGVQREAAQVRGAEIDITANTSGITAGVAEVRSALASISGASAEIPIGFDASAIDRETAGIINRIKAEVDRNVGNGVAVETSLNIATEAAAAEVGRMLAALPDSIDIPVDVITDAIVDEIRKVTAEAERSGSIDIPVYVDTAEVEAEIRAAMGASRPPIEVPVTANTDPADNQIDALLRERRDPIEVPITVDAAQATAGIEDVLRQSPDAIEVPVSADTTEAVRQVGRLRDEFGRFLPRGGSAKIKVEADVDDVVSGASDAADALDDIGDAASDASKEADKAARSLAKIESAAAKAGAAADGLEGAFRRATQEMEVMELVGEAILAIATSIVKANVAFEDFGDAVQAATGDAESAQIALAMLEEFSAATAISLEDATGAFVEFRTNGLEASRSSMEAYGNVASGLNLTMTELAEAVGDAAQRNFSKLNETQLKAKESGDKVIFTYHGVTTEVENTSKAIAGFIKTMGNTEFAGRLKEEAEGVTGAFESMSEAWNEFSRDMGDGGLNKGLTDFQQSMAEASKEAEELGRIVGAWLGEHLQTAGEVIEFTVRAVSALVDSFRELREAIMNIPVISTVIGGVMDLREKIFSGINDLVPEKPEDAPAAVQPSAANNNRAFGTDTESPRKKKRTGKTEAERQAENFARQSGNNKEMLSTLTLIDESYERGRASVEGFRNSIEELNVRQSAQKSVGKENAEVIVEQAMAMKYLQEQIAYKADVLDQQEAIMQTVQLTEAFKDGSDAVQDAQAKIEAYNKAVELGYSGRPEESAKVEELEELARAALEAKENLNFEQSMVGLDQQIESAAQLATAFREGGPAIREATFEQQVYAQAVADGVEDEEDSIQAIRERMMALRELQEIQQSDEKALMAEIDLGELEAELRMSQMIGEARYIEAERLDMLTQKKRELKDATVTLTAEEEKQADAMARARYAMDSQSRALDDIANSIPNFAYALEEAAGGALLSFEDALVDIITGAKSAKEAFADMAKAIASDLARMAIRMAIIQPLAMMFGMGGAGIAGGVVMGGMRHTGGIVGTDAAPMKAFSPFPKFHTGGIVGDKSSASGSVNPYASFPKFHTGGLATNETPAVLMKGEGVFTEAQMRALAPVNNNDNSSRGVTVVNNINVTSPPGGDRGAAENQANNIAKMVSMAVDERLTQAQRPGGLLNANGGY